MAIEKKLIHFSEDTEFKKRLNNNEILDTSIVFVKDTNKIYTHGAEYQFVEWGYIGVVGSPEPPIEIPVGYAYVKPVNDDWWTDSEDQIILVME